MQQFVVAFWDEQPPSHPVSLILHLSLTLIPQYFTVLGIWGIFCDFCKFSNQSERVKKIVTFNVKL